MGSNGDLHSSGFIMIYLTRPNCASGSQEIGDFLGVALQVQQYAVRFSRVAALQCAALFAALKRANL